jgi:hypothetical protein
MKSLLLAETACLGFITLAMGMPDVGVRSGGVTNLTPSFDHYQVILDRQPFGRPAEAAAAVQPEAAKQAQAEQVLAKQIRLCAVTRTDQGLAAGLIDSSTNPPKNHYLHVGDSEDGITLVTADLDTETAEIQKDGASLTFTLTGVKTPATPPTASRSTPMGAPPPAPPSAVSTRVIAPRPLLPLPSSSSVASPPTPGGASATYIERLRKRREELLAQNAASVAEMNKTPENVATAAAQAALRKRNMDMIRRGEGSLGIPLTPEEDAQLVKEGILPAAQ